VLTKINREVKNKVFIEQKLEQGSDESTTFARSSRKVEMAYQSSCQLA
jgi:hypothetical protein